jgi:hypothetical protein
MAKAVGYAPSTIHRIWRAFGLQPHRSETLVHPAVAQSAPPQNFGSTVPTPTKETNTFESPFAEMEDDDLPF